MTIDTQRLFCNTQVHNKKILSFESMPALVGMELTTPKWEHRMSKASHDFQIFVKPTGSICNLGCDYCYYLNKELLYPECKSYRMPDDILESYIAQHIRSAPQSSIRFSWHGGEPTLLPDANPHRAPHAAPGRTARGMARRKAGVETARRPPTRMTDQPSASR